MSQPDWDRLSRRVDRNYHKDAIKSEVRFRGETIAQAPKTAEKTPQVTTHQIALNNAPTLPTGRYTGYGKHETIDDIAAELAAITIRLERGWEIMGGFDCPNIQPDRNRIEALTNTWVELNERAARLSREYVALTGGMWHADA